MHKSLLQLAFFLSSLLLFNTANAKTLYLDCSYGQCLVEQKCAEKPQLVLHFLIDTTNKKAWRLGSPVARPIKLKMNEEGQLNLLDEKNDGSINVTTIRKNLRSAHSIHPMGTAQSIDPVRQYYGICGERKMIAGIYTQ